MIHKIRSFNLFAALAIVTLFTTLQSSSCSKNDVVSTDPGNITGTWRVSLYWDKKDETGKFTEYNFTFSSGGTITATNGTNTINGSWSESSTRFIVNFGTTPVFSNLNMDWLKEEKTLSSIKLKDDNPLSDEKIQFIKN
jgi:hypothetical protein